MSNLYNGDNEQKALIDPLGVRHSPDVESLLRRVGGEGQVVGGDEGGGAGRHDQAGVVHLISNRRKRLSVVGLFQANKCSSKTLIFHFLTMLELPLTAL